MPKRQAPRPNIDASNGDALIRHHIEEAAVHLGMVAMLIGESSDQVGVREGRRSQLAKVGRYLKKLYVQYGGHPDA